MKHALAIAGVLICLLLSLSTVAADWKPVPSRTLYGYAASGKTSFHTQWGRYRITVDGDPLITSHVVIADANGRHLREVRAQFVDALKIAHLDGSRFGQLVIETGPMSNTKALHRQYIFAQDGGLHDVSANAFVFDLVATPEGKRLGVARSCGLLEWVGDICHACGPAVAVVFEWDGKRFRQSTRRYPRYALETANSYRRQILEGHFYSNDYAVGAAMGYYANMAEIGRGQFARRWLKRHVTAKQYDWVEDTIPEIHKRLAKIPQMVWTTRDTIIQAPS